MRNTTLLHWHQDSRDRMESNYFCLYAYARTVEYSSVADGKTWKALEQRSKTDSFT